MLSSIFAALAILGGLAALFFSIPIQRTPEYTALVAIAAFCFAATLGIWRSVRLIQEYVDKA